MNATLTTAPGRHDHPPQPGPEYPTRRVGALDRLALHLGVALVTWSRRPRPGWGERRAHRAEQRLALLARDSQYAAYLSTLASRARRERDECAG